MQVLFVKKQLPNGKIGHTEVKIIRSWQDASGPHVYLHANGVYGYKDGSPVRAVGEFSIIGDPVQRKAAERWWERIGRKRSEEFWQAKAKELEEKQLSGLPEAIEGDVSELDALMYIKRPVNDRRRAAFTEPFTWPEGGFPARPEWWGFATVIELAGLRYEQVNDETPEANEPDQESNEETDPAPGDEE